jgi:hypothetical protein
MDAPLRNIALSSRVFLESLGHGIHKFPMTGSRADLVHSVHQCKPCRGLVHGMYLKGCTVCTGPVHSVHPI